jgi:hypothetical protein
MGRMWIVLEIVVLAAVALLAMTEFFYPLLAGKPLFGSFRRKDDVTSQPSLDDEIADARRKAEEVKAVQRKADEHARQASQRKSEADDLMN